MSDTTSYSIPRTSGFSNALSNSFEDLRLTLSSFILHMQLGQLKRSLAKMSDPQLKEIGITRSQIAAYAESQMDV